MSDVMQALGDIEQLIRWHLCEQEGMTSGQPTPEEWENAVDAASEAVDTIRAALEAKADSELQGLKAENERLRKALKNLYNETLAVTADFYPGSSSIANRSRIRRFSFEARQLLEQTND